MPHNPDPQKGLAETKRALRDAGFQAYDVRDGFISLAERVRDNLILYSGIAVQATPPTLRVTLRAQSTHFPGQSQDRVRAHAEDLAREFERRGFVIIGSSKTEVTDPSYAERTLDIVHSVLVERQCDDWAEVMAEVRAAFLLPRTSSESSSPPPFSVNS
jgi:hypothetical protein